jgi:Arabinose-binding domain of AraC transcription regulator, N-term
VTKSPLPTVTGFAVKRAIIALRKRKVALPLLLRRAGLSKHDFVKRQHRISAAAQSRLFEFAAEALDDTAFGLHLAKETNPREAGLLFYVAAAARDVGEALALFERYCRIVNEAVRLELRRAPEGLVVRIDFLGLSRHTVQQNAEFGIAVLLKALRESAGSDIRPARVTFALARHSDLREFKHFYRCPVEFGAASDQLVFSNEMLAVPLVTGDRHLMRTLRPICDAAARERRTPKGSATGFGRERSPKAATARQGQQKGCREDARR